jgi:hypothetical protein
MKAKGLGLMMVAASIGGMTLAARADDKVGVAAAVNPDAVGQAPAQASRALFVGSDVLYKEHISTQGKGQVQLLFVDQSSLSVAPNSDVVLDEFVYDPATGAGRTAATISKGLLRYVGGRISKQSDVSFTTPSGVVSVRGGIAFVLVDQGGGTKAVFVYGVQLCVTSGETTECTHRPGYEIDLAGPGQQPGDPQGAPESLVAELMQQFQGQPGSTVGSNQPPPDLEFLDSLPPIGIPNGFSPYDTGSAIQNDVPINGVSRPVHQP